MGSNTNRRKLKNLFISKDTQRPLLATHVAYLLLVVLAVIAAALSPFYFDMVNANDLELKYFSAKMFIVLIERLALTGLLILLISFIHFLILTHKLCGPLVNIGHTIRRISRKDFTRMVYLRRGDFLNNEANQINTMMEELSGSIEIIKQENQLLLVDLEQSIKDYGMQQEIETQLKALKDRADRCRIQLDAFVLIGGNTPHKGARQLSEVAAGNPSFADEAL